MTLTQRQKQILQIISQAKQPPSIRTFCDAIGASNPMSVQADLTALYEKGYISRDRRLKRPLRFTA
jgi:SOS-response transcriptional repressor LexA